MSHLNSYFGDIGESIWYPGNIRISCARPSYVQSTNRFSFWYSCNSSMKSELGMYTPATHWTRKITKSWASNVGRNLSAAQRYPNYPLLGIFFWDPKKKFLKGVVRFSKISRLCRERKQQYLSLINVFTSCRAIGSRIINSNPVSMNGGVMMSKHPETDK